MIVIRAVHWMLTSCSAHTCVKNGEKRSSFTCVCNLACAFRSSAPLMTGAASDNCMLQHKWGIWSGRSKRRRYVYRVTQVGRIVDKMDLYAFYSELRPNTASIVTNLDYKKWSDEPACAAYEKF